ncbi:hypothetical protein CDAR_6591 [Caerostris darwini]|uniref:Uncharacterized protein n=1 Tax=Caerostris darwini TaxID=1538125 RepID=A0AAV4TA85_9ARAC|nr:hypothetical protein CDAR_6591 [Caerostris darwini]
MHNPLRKHSRQPAYLLANHVRRVSPLMLVGSWFLALPNEESTENIAISAETAIMEPIVLSQDAQMFFWTRILWQEFSGFRILGREREENFFS